ncbi:MAG: hypothetical protein CVV52_02360 [Spirochaetae bacterium HGW-Spirochaetae-8]|jgi:sensor histidine kinase YesM|nr:MAG: hypothetical protein CVV52_02360 [Spirochaetae bacterium HGW-Spirochaetae-8]
MKIRSKLILLAMVFSIGALVFAGLGVITWKRVRSINDTVEKGIEMQVRSRDVHSLMKDMVFDLFVPKIYGQLKSYTYSPRTNATVREWKSAVLTYQNSYYSFMGSLALLSVRDQEVIDQYNTANTMHQRAMTRLEQLEQTILLITERVGTSEEDRFYEILADEEFIPFFAEFRDTTYYFVDSFESYMDYFIKEVREYGNLLQRQTYILYFLVAFLTALAGITFSLLTAKDIITKIKRVEEAFTRVAKGDFSKNMDISGRDEFSDLARQFNSLSLDLKENVDNILRLTRAVGRSISLNTSMENLMQNVVHTIVYETHADVSFIHFLGTDPGSTGRTMLKLRAAEGDLTSLPVTLLQPHLQVVLLQGEPLVLQQEELRHQLPDLSSLMVLPLIIEKEVMGTLTVAIHKPAPPLTDLGVTRLSTFAEFASLTLDNHFKYAELIKKGEAEYQALQSQVQPHFIYNVLNGFIGLNRMGDKKSLESSIIELKEMLRYTQDSRTVTTIAEEFAFVENYCQLQKLRFGDRIQYSLHLGEGLDKVRIPRLILQPLVENAVIHGLEPKTDGVGMLEIEAFQTLENERTMVSVTVRDNGVGCDLGTLQEREHIGIGNVRRRFKYSFPNGAFNVRSLPGKGTEIRMTFNEMYHS